MTIIVAIKRNVKSGKKKKDEVQEVIMGTDQQVSSHYMKRNLGPKYIYGHNFVVAFCGSLKAVEVCEDIIQTKVCDCNVSPPNECDCPIYCIMSKRDAKALATLIRDHMNENGVGPAEQNELPNHSFGLLISTTEGLLFSIDSTYYVQEIKEWETMGSGMAYAAGAIKALWDKDISSQDLVAEAVSAACELDPFCGGDPSIIKVM